MRGGGEARHLANGVHPGIRAPGDGDLHALAEQLLEGVGQDALDRAQPGLRRPAGEAGTVILERQSEDWRGAQTSSMKTISDESERRGPSLRMRV